MSTLAWLVFFGGVTHFGVLMAAACVPWKLDFRGQLSKLHPMMRQLVWVYSGYIFMCIASFGLISVLMSQNLTAGEPLGRVVCGFIALFWGVRLLIQFFLFDPKEYLTRWFFKLGYHGLTLVFIFHSIVYTLAAALPTSY